MNVLVCSGWLGVKTFGYISRTRIRRKNVLAERLFEKQANNENHCKLPLLVNGILSIDRIGAFCISAMYFTQGHKHNQVVARRLVLMSRADRKITDAIWTLFWCLWLCVGTEVVFCVWKTFDMRSRDVFLLGLWSICWQSSLYWSIGENSGEQIGARNEPYTSCDRKGIDQAIYLKANYSRKCRALWLVWKQTIKSAEWAELYRKLETISTKAIVGLRRVKFLKWGCSSTGMNVYVPRQRSQDSCRVQTSRINGVSEALNDSWE